MYKCTYVHDSSQKKSVVVAGTAKRNDLAEPGEHRLHAIRDARTIDLEEHVAALLATPNDPGVVQNGEMTRHDGRVLREVGSNRADVRAPFDRQKAHDLDPHGLTEGPEQLRVEDLREFSGRLLAGTSAERLHGVRSGMNTCIHVQTCRRQGSTVPAARPAWSVAGARETRIARVGGYGREMPNVDSSPDRPRAARLHGVPLHALCLDLDDTILDNHGSYRDAVDGATQRIVDAHPDLFPAAVIHTIERTSEDWWSDPDRHARGRLDLPGARREVLLQVLDRLGRPDPAFAGALASEWVKQRDEALRLHDDAHALLARLRAAVPRFALVTNGAAAAQRAKIERFELAGYFDHVQVEGEFGAGKPEAAVYEHVLQCLDTAPDRALMVGDNFECDVLGPLAVGMHAAWIDVERKGVAPGLAPRPHFRLHGLKDLLWLLGV